MDYPRVAGPKAGTRSVVSPSGHRRREAGNHLERSLRRVAILPADIQSAGNQFVESSPSWTRLGGMGQIEDRKRLTRYDWTKG